jgi:hypothetical protein
MTTGRERLVVCEVETARARVLALTGRDRTAAGKCCGGRRPFGFESNGVTVAPSAAAAVLDASPRVPEGALLLPSLSCRVDSASGYGTGRPRYPQHNAPHYHGERGDERSWRDRWLRLPGRGSRLKSRSPSCPSPYRPVVARSPR